MPLQPGIRAPLLGAVVITLLQARPALAYVGPGAGMEFFGYALSLLAMVGIALLSFLTWPVYALLRWLRGAKPEAAAATPESLPSVSPPPAVQSSVGSPPS